MLLPRNARRRGAATVELAVLLPLLAFLFVAAVDYARGFYFGLTVMNCARNGAIFASGDPLFAADSARIQHFALADASNLSPPPTVTSSTGTGSDGHPYVEVSCSWQFETLVSWPGIPDQVNITRTVRTRVAPNQPRTN